MRSKYATADGRYSMPTPSSVGIETSSSSASFSSVSDLDHDMLGGLFDLTHALEVRHRRRQIFDADAEQRGDRDVEQLGEFFERFRSEPRYARRSLRSDACARSTPPPTADIRCRRRAAWGSRRRAARRVFRAF